MDKFFMHRIRHTATDDTWDKGIEIHDSQESATQSFHAYMGAYTYKNKVGADYVQCEVTDMGGNRLEFEIWDRRVIPEPEPIPDPEGV